MVINGQAGSVTLTPISTGVPVTYTLGAKGDKVANDYTALQNLITALGVLTDTDATFGTCGFLPAGVYKFLTQLNYQAGNWSLRGAGMRSTTLLPSGFTGTNPVLVATGAGYPYADILIEDLQIEGWAASYAGIVAEGSPRFTARRVYFNGFTGTALKVLGHGNASSGDAMFCIAEECEFNPQNAAAVCLQLSPNGSGGSHPDAFRGINNHVNGNANTTFFKADVVGATGGWLGASGPVVAFNRVENAGTFCDINTQGADFLSNWVEMTGGGTVTVTIQAGPANFPTRLTHFIGGVFATGGDRTKLVISDSGTSTCWVAVGNVGTAAGVASANLSGGTATLDASLADEWLLTITASTTIAIPNIIKGQQQRYHLTHDGTGTAFVLTWPATLKFAGGAFGTTKGGTNTANALDDLTVEYDGTNIREVSRALALA